MVTARRFLALALILSVNLSLFCDTRSQGIDILILLDRSKSMAEENKLTQSRDWLTASFIGPLVIPGDSVTLISFYGKTNKIWDSPINSETDKKNLIRQIASLKANGRWTDIGNALDVLKTKLEAFPKNDGRFKYIILITDEKQEAPPESRYFSKDGVFSHSFLTYTRKESHGAWKVITLGIGIDEKISKSMQEIIPVLDEMPTGRSSALVEGIPNRDGTSGQAKAALSGQNLALLIGAGAVLVLLIVFIALLIAKKRARDREQADNGAENRS